MCRMEKKNENENEKIIMVESETLQASLDYYYFWSKRKELNDGLCSEAKTLFSLYI